MKGRGCFRPQGSGGGVFKGVQRLIFTQNFYILYGMGCELSVFIGIQILNQKEFPEGELED